MAGQSIGISRKPFIVVVSGPSGVGKSTVVDRVLEHAGNFVASVSLTTRPPRGGERDGVDYFFVTAQEFARRRAAGELLEWAEVHGDLYGTPLAFVEKKLSEGVNVILEIDVQGGMSVKERYLEAVLIFLLPPSLEALKERLRGRGTEGEDVIRRRLETAKRELEFLKRYDYLVINDDIGRCVDDCCSVIRAEALRGERTETA
jgi:guanylate kinase